jgi:chromosomal replication initiation ATPase DnaA
VLDGRFRFENFVVGASNRLALAAAQAVAASPGRGGAQVALCGPSGVGKTHLLAALGAAIRAAHPRVSVGYLAAQPLMEDLHEAIATGQVELLLAEYAQWDVLLLDDVHLLSGRFETQYELAPVFASLQNAGRRIVLASDRPPGDIADLDDRLRSRLTCDEVVAIAPPELETRVAIVRGVCEQRGVTLDAAILEKIASAAADGHALLAALDSLVDPPASEPPAAPPRAPTPATPTSALRALGPSGRANDFEDPEPPVLTTPRTPIAQPPIPARPTPPPVRPTPPPAHPTPPSARLTPPPAPDEFETFVVEIASAVTMSVDRWRTRIAEAAAHWAAEGFRTGMFERALHATPAPDLGALEARFAAAVDRLRAMEREAARLDPKLAGLAVFRDPEKIAEAEEVLFRAFAAYDPPPGPDRRLTIDSFVLGERNSSALREAAEVIAVPGGRHNPLYVHGAASS